MENTTANRQTTLQKDKVLLRTLHEDDAAILAELANNKKIWDNVRDYIPNPYTLKDGKEFIEMTQKENPPLTFAITYEGNFCGVIGLVGLTDIHRKTAEIGYWLGEPYWGKNIMTTALQLITNYGLHQLGFIRIQTLVFEYNTNSMRVLEKCGYVKEGIFRKAIIKNDKIWDEHRFGIVK